MQKEIDTYKIAAVHKILPNDFGYTVNTQLIDIQCSCKLNHPIAKMILPVAENLNPIVVYANCARCIFAAFIRQLRETPKPEPEMLVKWNKFVDDYFDEFIEPLLRDFEYNVEDWLNHLGTLAKQLEVMEYYNDYKNGKHNEKKLSSNVYTLFCKREKQLHTGKMPKNRAISACPPNVKFVLGPVIWRLEAIFGKNLKGYKQQWNGKQAKMWEEVEDLYELRHKNGYQHTVDIDGSAWDTTMKYHMKRIVYKIYEYLADYNYIKHVPTHIFKSVATATERTLIAKNYVNGVSMTIFAAKINNTVFSGSPDTTFANTTINSLLNIFTLKTLGYKDYEYELDCSGDDTSKFLTHIKPDLQQGIITIWNKLGMLPKYVIVGDYSDITFCSTNVIPYKSDGNQKFKLVRQLDRMAPLSHYSESALKLSEIEMKHYYKQLALGIDHWAHQMPFYSSYSTAYNLHANAIKNDKQLVIKASKPKLWFPTETSTDGHKMKLDRVSSRFVDDDTVYQYLSQKYCLTKDQIIQHHNKICDVNTINMIFCDVVDSPNSAPLELESV